MEVVTDGDMASPDYITTAYGDGSKGVIWFDILNYLLFFCSGSGLLDSESSRYLSLQTFSGKIKKIQKSEFTELYMRGENINITLLKGLRFSEVFQTGDIPIPIPNTVPA